MFLLKSTKLSMTITLTVTFVHVISFSCYLAIYYILVNETVCNIKNYLCHNIKQTTSYGMLYYKHQMTITAHLVRACARVCVCVCVCV